MLTELTDSREVDVKKKKVAKNSERPDYCSFYPILPLFEVLNS